MWTDANEDGDREMGDVSFIVFCHIFIDVLAMLKLF